MTMRRVGRMHHLGTGAINARKRVLALADDNHVIVTDLATGEVLSTQRVNPDKTYWRNETKSPADGRALRKPRPITRDMGDT